MPANPVCIAEIRKIIDIILENHDIRLSAQTTVPRAIRVYFESDEKRSLSILRFHVKKWDDLYPEILKNCTERVFSFFDISSFGVSSLDFKEKVFKVANKIGFNKFDPNSPNYNVANFAVLKKEFKAEDGAYTQDEHEKGLKLLSKDIACIITKVLLEYYLGGSFKRASEYDFAFSKDEASNVGGLEYLASKYKQLSEAKPELFSRAFDAMDDGVGFHNGGQDSSFLAARRYSQIESTVDKRHAFNSSNASFNDGVGSFGAVDEFSESINEYLNKRFNTKDDSLQGCFGAKNKHLARYERQMSPDELSKFMSFDEENVLVITQNYLKLVKDYAKLEVAVAELEESLSKKPDALQVPESLALLPTVSALGSLQNPISEYAHEGGSRARRVFSSFRLRRSKPFKPDEVSSVDYKKLTDNLTGGAAGGGVGGGISDSRDSVSGLVCTDDYVDMCSRSMERSSLRARMKESTSRRRFATTCKDLKGLARRVNCFKSRRRAAISLDGLDDDLGGSEV